MNVFEYRNNLLLVEGVPLSRIAAEVGTPAYVYSRAAFTAPLDEFEAAFQEIPHLVCYSVKSAGNLSLLRLVAERGQGADIVSGGELFRCLSAGLAPGRVVFSGIGKTAREMAEALAADILMFNVESAEELDLLASTAGRLGRRARVGLRINPDVDPRTHPYIATGLAESKFGLSPEAALELYQRAARDSRLEVVGMACHIGSQLLEAGPFLEAADKLKALARRLRELGVELKYFDMGGGLGIRYGDEAAPTLGEYAAGLKRLLADLPGVTLVLEPGRYVAGNSAVLLVKVLYNKTNGRRRFVVVDGAMNDLVRPSLYDAYHEIRPVVKPEAEPVTVDVVGPICESGDFLAKNRPLPPVAAGDLLAVMSVGAYGYAMSSNYNARPRAAEVLVDGDSFRIIKPRETYEDLIRGE